VTPDAIDARALWPEVRAFNTVLAGLSFSDDCYTGLAALGVIEDLFAGISARLGRAIVARGWLPPGELAHYTTHEALDVSHADGFYKVIEGPYAAHPRHAYQVTQGLELGAYAFLRMYEDLHRARRRRWTREVAGPHSLADGWHLER
jgi:pyrroloquinoline-quinone synthase